MAKATLDIFPGDLLRDTMQLSAAAFGLWVRTLMRMHLDDERGVLSLRLEAWARLSCGSEQDTRKWLAEIVETCVADCKIDGEKIEACHALKRFCHAENTEKFVACNAVVTLVNRRMQRKAKALENARLRQKRKRGCAHGNADVTQESLAEHLARARGYTPSPSPSPITTTTVVDNTVSENQATENHGGGGDDFYEQKKETATGNEIKPPQAQPVNPVAERFATGTESALAGQAQGMPRAQSAPSSAESQPDFARLCRELWHLRARGITPDVLADNFSRAGTADAARWLATLADACADRAVRSPWLVLPTRLGNGGPEQDTLRRVRALLGIADDSAPARWRYEGACPKCGAVVVAERPPGGNAELLLERCRKCGECADVRRVRDK